MKKQLRLLTYVLVLFAWLGANASTATVKEYWKKTQDLPDAAHFKQCAFGGWEQSFYIADDRGTISAYQPNDGSLSPYFALSGKSFCKSAITTDENGNIITHHGGGAGWLYVYNTSTATDFSLNADLSADYSVPNFLGGAEGDVTSETDGGAIYLPAVGKGKFAVFSIKGSTWMDDPIVAEHNLPFTADVNTTIYKYNGNFIACNMAKGNTYYISSDIDGDGILEWNTLVTPGKVAQTGMKIIRCGVTDYIIYPYSASGEALDGFAVAKLSTDADNPIIVKQEASITAPCNDFGGNWLGARSNGNYRMTVYQYCPGGCMAAYIIDLSKPDKLYLIGEIEESLAGWSDPSYGYALNAIADGVYQGTVTAGANGAYFSISAQLGADATDWAGFNAMRYGITKLTKYDLAIHRKSMLLPVSDGYTPYLSEGTYTLTIDLNNSYIDAVSTATPPTYPNVIYPIGSVDGKEYLFATDDESIAFTQTAEGIYTGVATFSQEDNPNSIKFASVLSMDNNFMQSYCYGTANSGELIEIGNTYNMTKDCGQYGYWQIPSGTYQFTVNLKDMTMTAVKSTATLEKHIYLVGEFDGHQTWSPSDPVILNQTETAGIFEGTATLSSDTGTAYFSINAGTTVPTDWATFNTNRYGVRSDGYNLDQSKNISITQVTDGFAPCATNGEYKFTVDMNNNYITLTPTVTPVRPANLYVVGDMADGDGWDAASKKYVLTGNGNGLYTGSITSKATNDNGAMLFVTTVATDDDSTMYEYSYGASGTGMDTEPAYDHFDFFTVNAGRVTPFNIFLPKDDTYNIVINTNLNKMAFSPAVPQQMFVVGQFGTDGAIDYANRNIVLKQTESGVYEGSIPQCTGTGTYCAFGVTPVTEANDLLLAPFIIGARGGVLNANEETAIHRGMISTLPRLSDANESYRLKVNLNTNTILATKTTSIDNTESSDIKIIGGIGKITVEGESRLIEIYSMDGCLISSGANEVNCPSGLYIVKTDKRTAKVTVR